MRLLHFPQDLSLPSLKEELACAEAHAWWADIESVDQARVQEWVPAHELKDALEYSDLGRRAEYLASRVIVRRVLGLYLGIGPKDLNLNVPPAGKPGCTGIEFNFSHSSGRLLLGVSFKRPVGVDLERIRMESRPGHFLRMAERFFSDSEMDALRSLQGDPVRGTEFFFRLWCLRESIVKSTGAGVWKGFKDIAIEIDLKTYEMRAPLEYDYTALEPEAGFVGAIVLLGSLLRK